MNMVGTITKRLTIVFTSVIVAMNVLGMSVLLLYHHISARSVCTKHMTDDINNEFIPNYRKFGIHGIVEMHDEDYFQIIQLDGHILAGTVKSEHLAIPVSPARVQEAFSGKTLFEDAQIGSSRYLVAYFPIDNNVVGRAATSTELFMIYERDLLRIVLFCIPGMLLLSYGTSRVLLHYLMKPAADFCVFQENFLSNVSHELRSPLSSVQGNIEVALRKERSAGEYRETLELCLQETRSAIEVLKNLQILALSGVKPLELEREKADIKELLLDIVHAFSQVLQGKRLELHADDVTELACICDRSLLKRVIENLIDNAVKYSPEDDIIRIYLAKESRAAVLTIENTAVDIREDEIKSLLNPFQRGKGVAERGIEGKGLGLYIADYIMHSHNGRVDISLKPGNIFSVAVSIPLA